jgi:hypothetical protein
MQAVATTFRLSELRPFLTRDPQSGYSYSLLPAESPQNLGDYYAQGLGINPVYGSGYQSGDAGSGFRSSIGADASTAREGMPEGNLGDFGGFDISGGFEGDIGDALGFGKGFGQGLGNVGGILGLLAGLPGLGLLGTGIGTGIDQVNANSDLGTIGGTPLDFGDFLSALANNASFGAFGTSTQGAKDFSAGSVSTPFGDVPGMSPGSMAEALTGPSQAGLSPDGYGGLPSGGGFGGDMGGFGMDLGDLGGMAGGGSSPGGY